MPDQASPGPGPSAGVTPEPAFEPREIHNWTELLSECQVALNEDAKRVVLFVLYLAIFVLGLVENVLVICVRWRHSGRGGLLGRYVLHMALADLGVVLTLPVWMLEMALDYTWLWGGFSCRFVNYFYFANMYSSLFFLACLSVDHYLALVRASPSRPRARALCAGIWVLSALLPLPQVPHTQLVDSFEPMCLTLSPYESSDTWALVIDLAPSVLGFLLPLLLIVVFNVLTACRLRRTGRAWGRRHCVLVSTYTTVFILSWLPYHTTTLLLALHGTWLALHCTLAHVLYFFYDVVTCLSMLHCTLNPLLYNFLSRRFRGQLLTAVVHYLPKVQARAGRRSSSSSSSSTQHSIIITKEDAQPPAVPTAPHQSSQVPSAAAPIS